jgi:hypothetical protein
MVVAEVVFTTTGGRCHVLPGTSCHHREVVFFDKKIRR